MVVTCRCWPKAARPAAKLSTRVARAGSSMRRTMASSTPRRRASSLFETLPRDNASLSAAFAPSSGLNGTSRSSDAPDCCGGKSPPCSIRATIASSRTFGRHLNGFALVRSVGDGFRYIGERDSEATDRLRRQHGSIGARGSLIHRSLLGFQLSGSHAELAQNHAANSWRQIPAMKRHKRSTLAEGDHRMTPLVALSIDLERTAVGLRLSSQATYQALPRHAGSLGRLYPNVNLTGC